MRGVRVALVLAVFWVMAGVPRHAGHAISRPMDRSWERRNYLVKFAGGWDALDGVRTLAFDFRVETGKGAPLVFHHAYDKGKGLYRYECSCADFAKVPVWDETAGDRWQPAPNPPKGERLVAIYRFPRLEGTVSVDGKALAGPENARILRRVHSRVMNERAWMFLPLFVDTPRAQGRLAGDVDDPEVGRIKGVEVWWGEERGQSDVYTLWVDEAGTLVRTDYRLKHDLAKSTTVYWRDWKSYGPVRIAGERYLPDGGKRLLFENVRVNEPVEVEPTG